VFTIVAHVSPAATSPLSNQATVSSPIDRNSANNRSNVVSTAISCSQQGSATGSVRLGSGTTCIIGATITGNLIVPAGASVVLVNSTVRGTLSASRPGSVSVCNTTIGGNVRITGATGFVLLGDPGDDLCQPNNIHGTVTLRSNHSGVELVGNHIDLNASVNGTTGIGPFLEDIGVEIEGNTIGGKLTCLGNAVQPVNDGHANTVTGAHRGQCAVPPFV
jgi:hypothetical protein